MVADYRGMYFLRECACQGNVLCSNQNIMTKPNHTHSSKDFMTDEKDGNELGGGEKWGP